FIDTNNNGIYEPFYGDYPKIKGDLAVYFIINDDRNVHTVSGGEPLIIEIHGMAYGFNCPGSNALDNTLFLNYSIFNRSQNTYADMYIGFFMDLDIGGYTDDFMACDVNRSTFYAYNGDSLDESSNGATGYGTSPPAQSCTFLNGPLQDADGSDNNFGVGLNESVNGIGFGDGIIDNERRGLDRFISDLTILTDPTIPISYYNILQGKMSYGPNLTYGGTGTNGVDTCKFMFPKDSDPYNFGTWGSTPNYPFSDGWSEENENAPSGERRGVGSTGPFTFEPGDIQEITIAFVFAESDTGSQYSSVVLMQQYIDDVRGMYVADTTPCGYGVFSSLPEQELEKISFEIYPNPTSNLLHISGTEPANSVYRIYDMAGKLVAEEKLTQSIIDVSRLSTGLYFIKIDNYTQRFIKN
ncbi:MAG: T9SS type A sorting domain-containing protein, partial [Flavobacteriales bacterium]|nr:T9SS type A sorting domain-containing protein [Flavobacteriales bacterium]